MTGSPAAGRIVFVTLLGCCILNASGTSRRQIAASETELLQHGHCPHQNNPLSVWLKAELKRGGAVVPQQATDLESFLVELKPILDQRTLPDRPFNYLLSDAAPFQPTCSGDWLEFGVFNGDTINLAARSRQARCGQACPSLFGFDTFTGLPEAWVRSEGDVAEAGRFSTDGKFPKVEQNVQLVKGLFSEMLPLFEAQHRQHTGNQTISFLHIDCDLYAGTKDVLHILNDRIKPGTIIVFDDLVNYNNYREGEVKALWEWLQESGAKLATVGMLGPLPGKDFAMDLHVNEPNGEHPWFQQSVGFVVAQAPRPRPAPATAGAVVEVGEAAVEATDASNQDPITSEAEQMKGDKELGALGHFRPNNSGASKRVPVQEQPAEPADDEDRPVAATTPHTRISRSTRDKHRADSADVSNREAIIPLKDLDVDPEGDVPQDDATALQPLPEGDKELSADSAENLDEQKKQREWAEKNSRFVSSLDINKVDTLSD